MYFDFALMGFLMFIVSFGLFMGMVLNPSEIKNPILKGFVIVCLLFLGIMVMFHNVSRLDDIASMSQNEEIYFINATLYAENEYEWIFKDDNGDLWSWGYDEGIIYTYGTSYLLSINNNGTYNTNTDDILLIIWQEGGEQIYYG